MTLKVGDKLPGVALKTLTPDGVRDVSVQDLCRQGTTILFAVPGAFTPQCSARHLPGFVERAAAFKAKGVDRIACVAVNDAFVMGAWARANNVGETLFMLADGNGEFTCAAGLDADARPYGMGLRSQRYAMVVKDGVVTQLFVDPPGAFEVSAAENVLSRLQ